MFGFVRETEEEALKAGVDVTGIPRTGLDIYLKTIYPDVQDFAHNKAFPGLRIRPDYRSDTLKLIVEFDGIPHFLNKAQFDKDMEHTAIYEAAGYKVVRIPLYLNLTCSVINRLFDLRLNERFFDADVSPFNKDFQPNFFCLSALKRMIKDFKEYAPEQIPTMLKSIESKSPDEFEYIKESL